MRQRLKAFASWFEAQAIFLRSRSPRPKLGHNTYLAKLDGTNPPAFAVILHKTPILTFWQDGSILLDSGGWKTKTTKARINAFLPAGYSIRQERWNWILQTPDGERRFHDGLWVRGESALAAEPEAPSYTVSTVRQSKRGKRLPRPILGPRDISSLISPLVAKDAREHFYAVYLNTRNRVLGVELVSLGTLNASLVHPREVFSPALTLHAAALVVAHNHPSGEVEPSEDDIDLSRRLQQAGDILGIGLLDSVIVAGKDYYSLKEGGDIR